jgi:hypothetical protein
LKNKEKEKKFKDAKVGEEEHYIQRTKIRMTTNYSP